MTKRILITGAAGFIGHSVIEYLSRDNYEIIGTWNQREPEDCLECVRYVKVDLGNRDELEQLFLSTRFDAIIHFAGQMKGQYVRDFLRNSVNATDYLIMLAQEYDVKTFVYASSIAIYGNTEDIVKENSDRVNLDDYGMVKYIGERLLEDADIKNRITIRLPRMLGKKIDMSYPWLPKLAKDLMENREVRYFNPDLLYNNLAHTDTLGKFLQKILEDTKNIWRGYHVVGLGSADPMRVIDIINQMKLELKSVSPLREITENLHRNTCFGIDISRAQEYGYEPWTVKETLTRFIQDLQEEKQNER